MKKLFVLMFVGLAFIACDYAKDSVELNPDIEITWVDPLGIYVAQGDTTSVAPISTVCFVNENSLDCYLQEFIYEFCDAQSDAAFFTSEPFPLYAKVEGVVERPYVDTTKILNLEIPIGPAVTHMSSSGTHSVKTMLKFVYSDEYFNTTDTALAWYGIYMFDTTNTF